MPQVSTNQTVCVTLSYIEVKMGSIVSIIVVVHLNCLVRLNSDTLMKNLDCKKVVNLFFLYCDQQGTVSLNHLGGKTGILCTEKGAPKHLVKRPPGHE
jgi:hypothetical protein